MRTLEKQSRTCDIGPVRTPVEAASSDPRGG